MLAPAVVGCPGPTPLTAQEVESFYALPKAERLQLVRTAFEGADWREILSPQAIQIAYERDPLHRGSREEQMREMAIAAAGVEWALYVYGTPPPRLGLARTGFDPEPYMRRVLRTRNPL
jgi:hypothetical protein